MVDPAGSAARMETSVHSPGAGEVDETPDVGALAGNVDEAPDVGALAGASELDGAPWVGVADAVASLEDADEHPVINVRPVPPTAKRIAALLTVV